MTEQNKDGNGLVPAKVMQQTLDKFLDLVDKNNKNYSAMATSIETLAASQVALTDKVNSLERTIEEEQLAEVLGETASNIKFSVQKIQEAISKCSVAKLTFFVEMGEHLKYANLNPKDMATKIKSHLDCTYFEGEFKKNLTSLLTFVAFFRKRAILMVFILGIAFGTVFIKSGLDIWTFVSGLIVKGAP